MQHFFDGESLPAKELEGAGNSERTKKNMETMEKTSMGIFRKLSQYSHDSSKL